MVLHEGGDTPLGLVHRGGAGLSSLFLSEGGDAAQGLAHRGGAGLFSLTLPEVGDAARVLITEVGPDSQVGLFKRPA